MKFLDEEKEKKTINNFFLFFLAHSLAWSITIFFTFLFAFHRCLVGFYSRIFSFAFWIHVNSNGIIRFVPLSLACLTRWLFDSRRYALSHVTTSIRYWIIHTTHTHKHSRSHSHGEEKIQPHYSVMSAFSMTRCCRLLSLDRRENYTHCSNSYKHIRYISY